MYDYEILKAGKKYKLKVNKGMFAYSKFELTNVCSDTIGVDTIGLVVQYIDSFDTRTNENQTQVKYVQIPSLQGLSTTGLVENDKNLWMHPIRVGFFNCLETAPFPYVKMPLNIGMEWHDQMKIGQAWGNEMWGRWEGDLLLTYNYKITDKVTLKTNMGEVYCFIIESTAESSIGTTKLKSYFSTEYGFIRWEYQLLNDLSINMWLVAFSAIGTK